ncbi:2-oxo acid dehydrogenase subunit E2 [Microbacterium thalassium]|uniref:2-oxo acid dehydrogenase subunit E2 n=1 Tax=Microbacterium TaxID=33882 RepID=UPI002948BECB|nr:2-oxo acid dehydrogenase subunit E2 [Microbacterium thalassium]
MPSLGADMTEAKVVEWLVKPGDRVHRGDVVAEVDTEKTVMEIEAFEDAVVSRLLVPLGETVPVGTPIALFDPVPGDITGPGPDTPQAPSGTQPSSEGGHEPAQPSRAAPRVAPPVRRLAHELHVELGQVRGTGQHGAITRADVETAAHGAAPPAPAPSPALLAPQADRSVTPRVRSSPRARRLASERGLDLAAVHGTGPGAAVTAADLTREVSAARPSATGTTPGVGESPPEREPGEATEGPAARSAKLRRAVGALMARSKQEIPHYYLSAAIDLGPSMEWMRRVNAQRPIAERLVPSVLLLAAAAKAAKAAPGMNGFYREGAFEPSERVHLGVAVALRGGGLIAPAILDADSLTVDELMRTLRDLVARSRAGRLQRAEMTEPTITVTNLGDLGVDTIFGVIYPPQVALVGFGAVREAVVARDGCIGIRPMVSATLSADHRVSDGLAGIRMLTLIEERLQNPEEL